MKKILLAFICIIYSIAGISQTEWTETAPAVVVENPFEWACDSVQWYAQEWDATCITAANYYIDTLVVDEGEQVSALSFDIVLNDTYMGPINHFSYDIAFPGVAEGDLQHTAPGLMVVNTSSGEEIHYENRHDFADNNLQGSSYELDLALAPGVYVVYVINESLIETVQWTTLGYCFPNWEGYCLPNMYSINEALGFFPDWIKLEGEDIQISDISYEFHLVAPEANIETLYQVCDGEEFHISAGCVTNENAGEYSYGWDWKVPNTELWSSQSDSCFLTVSFEHDTTSVNPYNSHEYRFIQNYSFADSDTTYFEVQVSANPEWDYTADALSFEQLDNDLLFSVVIPSESQNFTDEDIDGDYEWNVNEGFDGADLFLDVSDGGYSCEFLFSPFDTEEDTVGSFIVNVALNSGCSTIDTTYVVYIDVNGDGAWDVGDSIDFRSFILNPSDTTDISIQELVGRSMKMYPNPTNNNLTLEHDLSGPVTFTIHSITGAMIRSERITTKIYKTSVGDLEKGVYIITINDGQETLTSRLMKSQ